VPALALAPVSAGGAVQLATTKRACAQRQAAPRKPRSVRAHGYGHCSIVAIAVLSEGGNALRSGAACG